MATLRLSHKPIKSPCDLSCRAPQIPRVSPGMCLGVKGLALHGVLLVWPTDPETLTLDTPTVFS